LLPYICFAELALFYSEYAGMGQLQVSKQAN
jgi:hypothetical protein